MSLLVCTRVYANGDCIRELRRTDVIWLDHNRTWRPGLALVVDGVTHELGYLTAEGLEEVKRKNPRAFRPVDPLTETKETAPISS